jgi:hypothetical protein
MMNSGAQNVEWETSEEIKKKSLVTKCLVNIFRKVISYKF